ncbi:MAG: MBOAT family protein [Roseburia sp.]|nr:MBOAT family protein [Ruminococcus sp.]MCM1155634.1 MBOAT family protein [Roseburia sp.]MCM1241669.1 MBOAT family protein [Roseburia sp.]
MLFNSLEFLIFFPLVIIVYFILPKKIKQFWLLIASYFFYMCWNAKYAVLILFSTIITYSSGLILEKIKHSQWTDARRIKYKKLTVVFSFVLNLAVLFYFKYTNFFLSIAGTVLRVAHIELNMPEFDIILPVGISFYTFQALSYTMDVYRDEVYAEKNFFRYALFVSFFPQLVAGPIERSKNLLKQLDKPKKFNYEAAREGFLLMLWGYFLKIVLADRIAVFVDTVYGDYQTYAGSYLIVATMLFAIQIYCDFYGYSVIAIGAAKILGIQLMENFDAPYLTFSVAEFWRRWHISLTSWFRDYLYIPLGGNRKGKWRKYANILVVFSISGLWHGANASFIVWGGLNGLYQIIGEIVSPIRNRVISLLHLNRDSLGHRLLRMLGTFLLVDISWIFFRAAGLMDALRIIRQMMEVKNPWIFFDGSLYLCGLDSANFHLMLFCLCILLFADYCKVKGVQIRQVIIKQDYWFRCLFVAFAIWGILTFGVWGANYDAANFIYFQF